MRKSLWLWVRQGFLSYISKAQSIKEKTGNVIHQNLKLLIFGRYCWENEMTDVEKIFSRHVSESWYRNLEVKSEVRVTQSVMSDSLWPHGLFSPWNFPGQNTGVGNHSLLQGIFPTQGSNPGFPHCRWILYHLSHRNLNTQYLRRQTNF